LLSVWAAAGLSGLCRMESITARADRKGKWPQDNQIHKGKH
jgi:hypothetical protein